ncbi:MAG: hypothetical protein ABIJ57_09345, partial [Pseudomonadota bacterium]
MKTGRILIILMVLLLPTVLNAGVTKIQIRPFVGLTGGGNALDGISGYTIHPDDMAIGHDGTGVTLYVLFPQDTGVTTESTGLPAVICPDDQQAGGTATGTTTWIQQADSSVTIQGKSLYIDTTRWDDGSGGMASSVVRAGVSATVLDKATDAYVQAETDTTAMAALTAHTTTLSGTSGEATKAWLDAAGAPGATSGTSIVQPLDLHIDALRADSVLLGESGSSTFWLNASGDFAMRDSTGGVTIFRNVGSGLSIYYIADQDASTGTAGQALLRTADGMKWQDQLSDVVSGITAMSGVSKQIEW